MNRLTTFAAVLAVLSGVLFAQSNYTHLADHDRTIYTSMLTSSTNAPERSSAYERGVNDALDAITLLSLEQRLEGTNRTWGAMADIVRERLHVEKR
jgi:hypothetical protein